MRTKTLAEAMVHQSCCRVEFTMGRVKANNLNRDGMVPSPRGDAEPGSAQIACSRRHQRPAVTKLASGMFRGNDARHLQEDENPCVSYDREIFRK